MNRLTNILRKYQCCVLLATICLLSGCVHRASNHHKTYVIPQKKQVTWLETYIDLPPAPPPINIWIHGTRFFPFNYFFKDFFYCPPGLTHVTDLKKHYPMSKKAHALIQYDPYNFNPHTFYLFGWCGSLSFDERIHWAQVLYEDIKRIVAEYKETYNTQPIIRIFAHSHGGNVALNLAKIKKPEDDFVIDELVLMGTPVQSQTKKYIQHPMFKKIYALYSQLDILQVADPQGLYYQGNTSPFFSKRCFEIQDNLYQVKVKFNGRAMSHTQFTEPNFLQYIPDIIRTIDEWHETELADLTPSPETQKLVCLYSKKKKAEKKWQAHQKQKARKRAG